MPELSGKTAQFEICLHTVERKQVPPVDDALAKSLGYEDLEALRESLREKKRLSHEANADRIAGAALLDMAVLSKIINTTKNAPIIRYRF